MVALGVQGAVRIHTIRLVYILWQVHSEKSGQVCRLLSHGLGTTVAVPGDMVYCMEGHAPGLYRPYEESSYHSGYIEGGQFCSLVSSMDGFP